MDSEATHTLMQMLAELSKPRPNLAQVRTLNMTAQAAIINGSDVGPELKAYLVGSMQLNDAIARDDVGFDTIKRMANETKVAHDTYVSNRPPSIPVAAPKKASTKRAATKSKP